MPLATVRRGWLEASVALLFSLALAWGLLRFGAAETAVLYRFFLFLLVPAAVAVIALPLGQPSNPRVITLYLLGVFLLGQVALRSTLAGRGWVHLTVGWLAFFITLALIRRSRRLVWYLLLMLILLGVMEALFGLVQSIGGLDYIGSHFRNSGRIATGSFINRNHYAALLNMTLPLAVGALFTLIARREGDRDHRRSESMALSWMVILASSFMGLAILLSQSRGGTISLLATLLFIAMLLSLHWRRSSGRGPSGAAAWILVFTILCLGGAIGLDALMERFGRLDEGLARATVYGDTLDLIADFPVMGVGPGMYRWRFRPYQSRDLEVLYDHTHNDYLESAADWGVPMALAVWGFIFWIFYASARRFLESRHPGHQGLALGTSAAILSVLVHSLVDFSLQIPSLLAVFCAILALAFDLVVRAQKKSDVDRYYWARGRPL